MPSVWQKKYQAHQAFEEAWYYSQQRRANCDICRIFACNIEIILIAACDSLAGAAHKFSSNAYREATQQRLDWKSWQQF
jgi:hypothetical protein